MLHFAKIEVVSYFQPLAPFLDYNRLMAGVRRSPVTSCIITSMHLSNTVSTRAQHKLRGALSAGNLNENLGVHALSAGNLKKIFEVHLVQVISRKSSKCIWCRSSQ